MMMLGYTVQGPREQVNKKTYLFLKKKWPENQDKKQEKIEIVYRLSGTMLGSTSESTPKEKSLIRSG